MAPKAIEFLALLQPQEHVLLEEITTSMLSITQKTLCLQQ